MDKLLIGIGDGVIGTRRRGIIVKGRQKSGQQTEQGGQDQAADGTAAHHRPHVLPVAVLGRAEVDEMLERARRWLRAPALQPVECPVDDGRGHAAALHFRGFVLLCCGGF